MVDKGMTKRSLKLLLGLGHAEFKPADIKANANLMNRLKSKGIVVKKKYGVYQVPDEIENAMEAYYAALGKRRGVKSKAVVPVDPTQPSENGRQPKRVQETRVIPLDDEGQVLVMHRGRKIVGYEVDFVPRGFHVKARQRVV